MTTTDTLLELISPILTALRDEYPQITIELVAANSFFTLTKRDAIDIAIRLVSAAPENLGWAGGSRRLRQRRMQRHPIWRGQADPTELSAYEWIGFEDSLSHLGSARWGGSEYPRLSDCLPVRIRSWRCEQPPAPAWGWRRYRVISATCIWPFGRVHPPLADMEVPS